MVKQNLVSKKRGRPKGSKNKRKVLSAHKEGSIPRAEITGVIAGLNDALAYSKGDLTRGTILNGRYKLKTRIEKNELDAAKEYYFIYDLNRGAVYPEIIARFTVETEAKLCVEFLNGVRKISKKEYEKKRICIL